MDYKIRGKVVSVGETKEFGSNGFRKREVVVDTTKNEAYPSPVPVTLKKDDCAMAATLNVGDVISVEGFIEGRKWDGPNGTRYFVDIVAKSVIVEERAAAPAGGGVRDWDTLVAFAKERGMGDADALKKICREYTEKRGLSYSKMTAKDWTALSGAVIDAIKAEEAKAEAAAVQEDMPF